MADTIYHPANLKQIPHMHKINSIMAAGRIVHADIDECNIHTDTCTPLQDCNNKAGTFECVCKKGYRMKESACEGRELIDFCYHCNT